MSEMSEQPKSSDILFPISDLDRAVTDVVLRMPAPPKWAAVNAVRHLNRAWKLRDVDHTMAAFRGITAEEEAAAALFLSLKRRRYENAGRIKIESHAHKNAVVPLLQAISHVMAQYDNHPDQQLYINPKDTEPRLVIRFRHTHPVTGEPVWAYPQPPLNFSTSRTEKGMRIEQENFESGIEALLATSNAKDMLEFVRDRANMRNKLLYATEQAITTFRLTLRGCSSSTATTRFSFCALYCSSTRIHESKRSYSRR